MGLKIEPKRLYDVDVGLQILQRSGVKSTLRESIPLCVGNSCGRVVKQNGPQDVEQNIDWVKKKLC